MTRNERKIAAAEKKNTIKVTFLQTLQWRLDNGFSDRHAWRHTVEETMAIPTPQEKGLYIMAINDLKRSIGLSR